MPPALAFLCKTLSPWTSQEDEIDGLREAALNRTVNWEEVASFANRANLAAALRQALVSKGLWTHAPHRLRDFLDEVYNFNVRRNEALLQELLLAAGFLNKAGITPLFMKGGAALAAELYPDPGIRFMWDLDLLVPEAKIEQAVSALKDRGYLVEASDLPQLPEAYWLRMKHYPPLIRKNGPVPIELHSRLLDGGANILDLKEVWREHTTPIEGRLAGASFALLSPTHQVIHCFVHSELGHRNHAMNRLDLRQLLHFAYLIRRYGEQIDWNNVGGLCKDPQSERAFRGYLYRARLLFGVETPLTSIEEPGFRRSFERAIFLLKWRRLNAALSVLRHVGTFLSASRLKRVYSGMEGYSVNRLRLFHLKKVALRYIRPGSWKTFIDRNVRTTGTIG